MDDADRTTERMEKEETLLRKPPYELPEGEPGGVRPVRRIVRPSHQRCMCTLPG